MDPTRPRRVLRLPRERDERGRPANARPRDRFGRPLARGAVDELPNRVEPDEVVSSVNEAFLRAVDLFDSQRFFEAHEFLEWIWKSDEIHPDDRDYWKGVTQVAVACCHIQRGNPDGALTLLGRAAGHLGSEPRDARGVDRVALRTAARRLADEVRSDGASPERDFPVFPLLPLSD